MNCTLHFDVFTVPPIMLKKHRLGIHASLRGRRHVSLGIENVLSGAYS